MTGLAVLRGLTGIGAETEAEWYANVQAYLREWIEEHVDGRADTWTPDDAAARS